MKLIVDIQEDAYDYLINTSFVENTEIIFRQSAEDRKHTMQLFDVIDAIQNGKPLKEWLSTFNTESAPICFNKIQELKRECEKE